MCAKAHLYIKIKSADLIFTSWLCLLPLPSEFLLQHRGGRKLPYNWASIDIQRGLGSLYLIMQGSTLKVIFLKWVVFCIFLQGEWGGENTKVLQNIASNLETLNWCSWRWHRLISPSSSHQGRIRPLRKKAGRTFRSRSGTSDRIKMYTKVFWRFFCSWTLCQTMSRCLHSPGRKEAPKRGGKNALKKKKKKFYLRKDAPMVSPLSEIPGHGEIQPSLAIPAAVLSLLPVHIKSS